MEQFDIVSFDKDGFTISIDPPPSPDDVFVYVQFKKVTWREYILAILRHPINWFRFPPKKRGL